MAIRTSEPDVKSTISTSLTAPQVHVFISDASLWVDEVLVGATPVLSAQRLEIIERYLACALIRMRDLGLKTYKMDDITEQYQVDPEVSDYLLRAAGFDSTGNIRRYFMAPKDVRPVHWRTGQSFTEEAEEVST